MICFSSMYLGTIYHRDLLMNVVMRIRKLISFASSLVFSLFFASAVAFAQNARCNGLDALFSLNDWRSLATTAFVKSSDNQFTTAKARVALDGGWAECKLLYPITDGNEQKTNERNYQCKKRVEIKNKANKERRTNEMLSDLRSLASEWTPCLKGWEKTDIVDEILFIGIARLDYNKGAQTVSFYIDDYEDGGPYLEIQAVSRSEN
jgi:hypothetical protein